MRDPDLWDQILNFQIDASEGSLPYSKKLAETEGWRESHANQVILEYRRFIYLCMIGEEQATPSYDIDRAWHLHLTYTRNYWEGLMPILPKPLHHEPCLGPEEMPRYEAQYEATKVLYREEFDRDAPRKVWPPAGAVEKRKRAEKLAGGAGIVAVFGVAFGFNFHVAFFGVSVCALIAFLYFVYRVLLNRAHGRKKGSSWEVSAGGCGGCGD